MSDFERVLRYVTAMVIVSSVIVAVRGFAEGEYRQSLALLIPVPVFLWLLLRP